MADLIFPQLISGNLVQYPIRKMRSLRTIKNVLADGSTIAFADSSVARMLWQLDYSGLSSDEIDSLQNHFLACNGSLSSFVFLDPSGNLLNASVDMSSNAWLRPVSVLVTPGVPDPEGTTDALTVTNTATAAQEVLQTLNIPSYYTYCFSLYARAACESALTVLRRGESSEGSSSFLVGPNWTRLVASESLNESGTSLSVGIRLSAGQALDLYGLQLETQRKPSRYRGTPGSGGVYPTAHYVGDQLTVVADGPEAFSTSIIIEAPVQD